MENIDAEEDRKRQEEVELVIRAGLAAQQVRQHRIVARTEPELIINRPTVLLTCICILRLHQPNWYNEVIVDRVRGSFPDIAIRAHDIRPLFEATCQNCPRWMGELDQVANANGQALTWRTIEVLRTNMLAYSPVLPQDHYDDARDGVRYLQVLVRVPEWRRRLSEQE